MRVGLGDIGPADELTRGDVILGVRHRLDPRDPAAVDSAEAHKRSQLRPLAQQLVELWHEAVFRDGPFGARRACPVAQVLHQARRAGVRREKVLLVDGRARSKQELAAPRKLNLRCGRLWAEVGHEVYRVVAPLIRPREAAVRWACRAMPVLQPVGEAPHKVALLGAARRAHSVRT